MFCTNCGNKLDDNAYVCVNCGVLVRNRSKNNVIKTRMNTNGLGIVSVVLGVISLIFSFMLYFHDISSVGMYTEIFERIIYVFDYSLVAIMLTVVTFIFSLVSKHNNYSRVGLLLSLLSFFFIVTEFVVVIIY